MTQKYKSIITNAGIERLAAGLPPDAEKVVFAKMAVGDGGGTLPVPAPEQIALVKEVWRAKINTITQHPQYANCVVVELVIPPEVGGFWMRELGLYDRDGLLIAVSNMAESYKPSLEEGSGRASTVRMVIAASNIASVDLHIDSSTVLATKEYVDDVLDKHTKSRNHPDATLKEKGFVQLSSATDGDSETLAATPKAIKAAVAVGNAANQNAEKRILKESNLADVPDKVIARRNMGLGTAAQYDAAAFLNAWNNLWDLPDKNAARLNLGLGSAAVQPDTAFLATRNNLADVPDKAAARRNMGLGSAATLNADAWLATSGNFADVPDKVSARKNLGLGSAAQFDASAFLNPWNNLWDVQDKAAALVNLGGVPKARRVNGHALSDDVNVTAQDIFDGQTVFLGEAADLNSYTTPGLYFQPANVNAQAGRNYPEPLAGSLEVYKHAGITQVYRIYNLSRSYVRACYSGVWTAWTMQYDAANPPTAQATGAVPVTGGDVAYLNNAKHYATREGAPAGAGAFAGQLDNPGASFVQKTFRWTPARGGIYVPLTKGLSFREGQGYPTAVSFGYLLTESAGFASPCVHVKGDNGDAIWRFDPNDKTLYAAGNINAGGAIYGKNGDVNGDIWGGWFSTWLHNQNAVRDNNINARATYDWVNQRISDVQAWTQAYFVQDIDHTEPVEIMFWDGQNYSAYHTTDGAHMANIRFVGGDRNMGNFMLRYTRKKVNGVWYVLQ